MLPTLNLTIRRLPNGDLTADLSAHLTRSVTDLARGEPLAVSTAALCALSALPDAYGAALTAMVLTARLKGPWERARGYCEHAGQGLHVRVLLDDPSWELHGLRWELLQDPANNAPLARQEAGSLARQVESEALYDPEHPPSPSALRVLVAVAGPSDAPAWGLAPLDVGAEAERALRAMGEAHVDLLAGGHPRSSGAASLRNIINGLRQAPHVLFLICHGRETELGTALYLVDDEGAAAPVTGEDLVAELSALSPAHRPLLAVLVACESAGEQGTPLAAAGPLLARSGIPAVVAMQASIPMAEAARFAERLLAELVRDGRIDRALAVARGELGEAWWAPVLWLRSRDGRLWQERPAPDTGARERKDRETALHALLHDHAGFVAGRLETFVGREAELTDIRARIARLAPEGGYITITGQAGQGKSSVIARLVADAVGERGDEAVAYHFIPFSPGPDHQVGLLRNLIARLALAHDLPEVYVASDRRSALRDYFAAALRELAARGVSSVIYIDGLDQLEEDANGLRDLSFLPEHPPPGIVFVLGTRPNDTLRPLRLLREQSEYLLPPLSRADFGRVLARRGVVLDAGLADRFYQAMEANALYLDLVAHELAMADATAPEQVIEQVAANPNNIFTLTVERLRRNRRQWREVLKPTLGLLLCARTTLSLRALRALTTADSETMAEGLQRLGGLVQRDGEGRYSLYHIKLRDYLRHDPAQPQKEYIFAVDEEESYHQRLAAWCAGGNEGPDAIWRNVLDDTIEQERRAYARNHYLAHVAAARSFEELWAALEEGAYARAKLRHDPSAQSLVLDLDIARQATRDALRGRRDQAGTLLARLWRYSLLRCSLSSSADLFPDSLYLAMAALGHTQEAIGRIELLTDTARRIGLLALLASNETAAVADADTRGYLAARAIELVSLPSRMAERQQLAVRLLSWIYDDSEPGASKSSAIPVVIAPWLARVMGAPATPEAAPLFAMLAHAVIQHQLEAGRPASSLLPILEHWRSLAPSWFPPDVRDDVFLALTEVTANLGFWQDAAATADSVVGPSAQATALGLLAAAQSRHGLDGPARATVDAAIAAATTTKIPGRSAAALAALAQTLANTGLLAEASRAVEAIDSSLLREEARTQVAVAIVRLGRLQQARQILHDTRNEGTWLRVCGELIYAAGRAGKVDEARAYLAQFPDGPLRPWAAAGLALALVELGRIDEAQAMARELVECEDYPRVARALGCALAGAGRLHDAHELVSCVAEPGIQAALLSEIAVNLARSGRRVEAAEFYQAARRAALKRMDLGHMEATLSDLAGQLVVAGRPREARAAGELIADPTSRSELLSRLTTQMTRAGAFREAKITAEAIGQVRPRSKALQTVVAALAQAGQVAEAHALAETIPDTSLRSQALSSVVVAMLDQGRFVEARSVAEAIEDRAEQWPTLRRVVAEGIRIGALSEACQVANHIADPLTRSRELAAVGVALSTAHRGADASSAFRDARRAAAQVLDPVGRLEALRDLGRDLAGARRGGDARSAFSAAAAVAADTPDSSLLSTARHSLIVAMVGAGFIDEARTLTATFQDRVTRTMALKAVADALIQRGKLSEAASLIRMVEGVNARLPFFEPLVAAFVARGDLNAAAAVLVEMPRSAERESAVRSLARGALEQGQSDGLISIAPTLKRAAESTALLQCLMEELEKRGLVKEADQVGTLIPTAWERDVARRNLVVSLVAARQSAEARVVASRIRDNQEQERAFGAIAELLAREGRVDDALAVADATGLVTVRASVQAKICVALLEKGLVGAAERIAQQIRVAKIRTATLDQLTAWRGGPTAHTTPQLPPTAAHSGSDGARRQEAISSLVREGEFSEAIAIAESIILQSQRDEALRQIAVASARARQFEAALIAADQVANHEVHAGTLLDVAENLLLAGQQQEALRLAKLASARLSDVTVKRRLATIYIKAGSFDEATATALSVDASRVRSELLTTVAIKQVESRQVAQALKTLGQVSESEHRRTVVQHLIRALVAEDDTARAHLLALSLPDTSSQAAAIVLLAEVLAKQGQLEDLLDLTWKTWLPASTLDELLLLLPQVYFLFEAFPDLPAELVGSFGWVTSLRTS